MPLTLDQPIDDIVDDITRREFIVGGISIAALLAACGSEDEQARPANAAAGKFPRSVKTGLGPVDIPAKPKRVVTLGYEADVVLAMGVVPVGMRKETFDPAGIPAYNRDAIAGKDVELIDTSSGVPYEQVAALRPDVILAGTLFEVEKEFDRLSKIAPVVSYRRGFSVDTWQEQAAIIGEALGEEEAAAAAVKALEDRIAGVASEHPEWAGKTFSLSFNFDVNQVTTVTNPEDFAIKLLNQLGLTLSPEVGKLTSNVTEQPTISYEQIGALDADVMLLSYVSDELRTELERLPLFTNLAAVRDGRYVAVDIITVSALRTPMVRGIGHALDQLTPQLEKALG